MMVRAKYCLLDFAKFVIDSSWYFFETVDELIPKGLRPVVKRPACLDLASDDGCLVSPKFTDYAFSLLSSSESQDELSTEFVTLLDSSNPTEEICDPITQNENDTCIQFVVCDFLGDIQQELYNTSLGSNTTFANLVVVPEDLTSRLIGIYGNETEFTGSFLLDNFGGLTLRRLFDFIMYSLTISDEPSRRRLKENSHERPEVVKRGSVTRAVRDAMKPINQSTRRMRSEEENQPLVVIELEVDFTLCLTFDFNFGNGNKQ